MPRGAGMTRPTTKLCTACTHNDPQEYLFETAALNALMPHGAFNCHLNLFTPRHEPEASRAIANSAKDPASTWGWLSDEIGTTNVQGFTATGLKHEGFGKLSWLRAQGSACGQSMVRIRMSCQQSFARPFVGILIGRPSCLKQD